MSKKKLLTIATVITVLVSVSGVAAYVVMTRENPETIRKMEEIDQQQEDLDQLLNNLE